MQCLEGLPRERVVRVGFVHLHVHSEYSLLESTCRIEALVKEAKRSGFQALAITDKHAMYGVIPFYRACWEHGIKPIIGMEVALKSEDQKERNAMPPSLVLLAKNDEGYRHLIRLATVSQCEENDGAIAFSDLEAAGEGLICLSSGIGGIVERFLLQNDWQEAERTALHLFRLFRGNFYLELQDHQTAQEKRLNLDVMHLSEKTGIPLVATNDVHYLRREDALSHDCLLCIKNGSRLKEENRVKLATSEYYLKSEEEMQMLFSDIPQALENTEKIAAACHVRITFDEPVLPKYPLPDGITSAKYLRKIAESGLKRRYERITPEIRRRLEHELTTIHRMGYDDYFLIVWDFMKFAHDNGIVTGPGRGSAAGSLVAYVLEITNVDPIRHELFFERFLNPERVSLPDIDIDFPDDRRDEVLHYVYDKYGRDHVAQIITFGTLGARAVIRDVGRVLGIEAKTVDRVAKQVPQRPGTTLAEAVRNEPLLQQQISSSPEVARLIEIAQNIEGLPRHTSTHAAGVVISDEPLSRIVPLKEGAARIALTQYAMEWLEAIGLLKMDFLGLRNLTLIEQMIHMIQRRTGKKPNIHVVDERDEKTFRLLASGDTTGIFQLESEGMRKVLRQLKPETFEDIVAVNALYRPGPMDHIPLYVARKHGREPIEYVHDDLKPILQKTYGVIVYQEQIMQIAATMAGFTLGEADLLRRAVSKKKRTILDKEKKHFIEGCLKNGYSREVAEAVYELILKFASYGFNRAHAVAYSVIAYQLAYLKAHYPQEFMAALLSSVMQNDRKLESYIKELKEKKIPLYRPSINESKAGFTAEDDGVRFGLLAIKNVGLPAVQAIEKARREGPFTDLFDFCARVSPHAVKRRTIEALICAGAMDDFAVDRAVMLATLDSAIEYGEMAGGRDDVLVHFLNELGLEKPDYEKAAPFSLQEKLKFEKEVLGFYLSAHPLLAYETLLKTIDHDSVIAARRLKEGKTIRIAGFVEKARNIKTKKNEPMAFVTVSDWLAELEVVIFPKLYRKNPLLYRGGQFLLIEGTIQKKDGISQLLAQKAMALDELRKRVKKTSGAEGPVLYLKIEKLRQKTAVLPKVKQVLAHDPGTTAVVIYYEAEQKTVQLGERYQTSASPACLLRLQQVLGEKNVVLKE